MTASDGRKAAPETPERLISQPLPGLRRRAAWPWLVAGLLLLGGIALSWRLGHSLAAPLDGSCTTWVTAKDKQALADYLNAQVRVPKFQVLVHTVAKHENYWGLARHSGVVIDSVVGFNPDMQSLDAYLGRAVLLPNQEGTLHQVLAGDSIESIEKDYGLESGTVRTANRLGWLGLAQGQVLFLPGARPRQHTPEMESLYEGRDFLRSPLAGRFTSFVGTRTDPFTGAKRHHNGVDIKAPFNSLVAASAAGKVVLAGWNDGFGKCVIIDHDRGYRTLYGHLNTILVRQGEQVRQFQYIGRVGMTGRTTGPHLHFTIWKDGKLKNPLKYLW